MNPPASAEVAPTLAAPHAVARRSNGWLWIVVGILVLSGLISMLELGVGLGLLARPLARPTVVAAQYYTAISQRDYAQAYTYLAAGQPGIPARPAFIAAAQARDAAGGVVTRYTLATDFPTNPQNVTVQVHRAKGTSYTVHLVVRQVGSAWKIVSFDGI